MNSCIKMKCQYALYIIYMMLIQEIQLFELQIEITFQWAVWFSQLLVILTVISATYSTWFESCLDLNFSGLSAY